jgi:hypothetical protein
MVGMSKDVVVETWAGCYSGGWPKELLMPETFAHPAKFAYGLIERIYDHARAEGWMPPGSRVLDPFAGVALGAIHALRLGCSWTGVELEPKFFLTGQANLAKWMQEYRHLPTWGPWALLVNGDSRRLLEHIPAQEGLCVSSPPYSSEGLGHNSAHYASNDAGRRDKVANSHKFSKADLGGREYGSSPGQLGAMSVGMSVASPPYAATPIAAAEGNVGGGNGGRKASKQTTVTGNIKHVGYGDTPGQLTAMVVASPPYADGCAHTGGSDPKPEHVQGGVVHHVAYGISEGQLGAMSAAVVSSPPYEDSFHNKYDVQDRAERERKAGKKLGGGQITHDRDYGVLPENLGNTHSDTFWSAAHAVVAQTYQLLRPGGHAMWVLKAYVRDKKLVDFPGQWQAMCEDVGFVTVHEHHALLTEDHGTQEGLFGEATTYTTERKSFFRRLAEKKGSPRIDYEVVLCMVKPAGDGAGLTCCVTSPPYSVALGKEHTYADHRKRHKDSQRPIMAERRIADPFYGDTAGNLGNLPEDTL